MLWCHAVQVIADITRRMGAGMAEFIPKEVATTAEYDKCAAIMVTPCTVLRLMCGPAEQQPCIGVQSAAKVVWKPSMCDPAVSPGDGCCKALLFRRPSLLLTTAGFSSRVPSFIRAQIGQ